MAGKGLLGLIAAACLALPAAASGATFTVNTTADEFTDGPHCAGVAGDCSLRDAAALANAADDADVVIVPAGNYVLKFDRISFYREVSIQGAGARTTTIDGNNGFGVFDLGNPDNASTPPITVSGLTVTGSGSGQGAILVGTDVTLLRMTVRGNRGDIGGGISVPFQAEGLPPGLAPLVRIVDSTISGNSSPDGGGVYDAFGAMTIVQSTITGNTATGDGEGGSGAGGGVYFDPQLDGLVITSSTIAGNTAAGAESAGGNVFLASQGSSLGGIVARGVVQPDAAIRNTIVSGGSAATSPNCAGTQYNSQGHNLVADGSCGVNASPNDGDLTGDPLLEALANNGGGTDTLALGDGSKAINAGDPNGCTDDENNALAADQRGLARPQGGRCDIGAYETAPPTSTTGDPSNVTSNSATIQGDAGNPNPFDGTAHFQFGKTTDYGQSTGDDTIPAGTKGSAKVIAGKVVSGSNPAHVTQDLSGLEPNTEYHYRLVVTNPDATRVGEDRSFVTGPAPRGNPDPDPTPDPDPDATPRPRKPNIRASRLTGRCYRSVFRARVRISVASATRLRRVSVKLDGRQVFTTTRTTFRLRVRAGRLRPGYHVLVIRATDRRGRTTTLRRGFTRCRPRPVTPRFTG